MTRKQARLKKVLRLKGRAKTVKPSIKPLYIETTETTKTLYRVVE